MIALRTPEDVRRLFSALGDDMEHESGNLSLSDMEQLALAQAEEPGIDWSGVGVTIAVVIAAGWTAIKGYERNNESLPWGLSWGVLGYLFPIPAVIYSAVVTQPVRPY